jgi:hypothetical protein
MMLYKHERTHRTMATRTLVLQGLDKRHPGLTEAVAGSYAEAARVCLDRHHTSPILLNINRGESFSTATTAWEATDQRTKLAWANKDDTTRDGAYCVAIAAIELTDGLVAISRAETRTGADYYLGNPSRQPQDLENSLRLEVSGIDKGNLTALRARLGQKVRQAQSGDSNLPAVAAVVGFESTTVLTADVKVQAE